MNATCPHCSTVFRVDPRKVPAGGARVRCSICRDVFTVAADGAQAPVSAPEPVAAAPAAPAAEPTPPPPATAPAPEPAPVPPAAVPAPPPQPAPAARPAAPSPFGASDPQSKARRLARALVSDIVTYHPDRREAALRDGRLRQEFMEEIKKSWEEYVGQVGTETAHGTTFFRDALNDILARGQKVF